MMSSTEKSSLRNLEILFVCSTCVVKPLAPPALIASGGKVLLSSKTKLIVLYFPIKMLTNLCLLFCQEIQLYLMRVFINFFCSGACMEKVVKRQCEDVRAHNQERKGEATEIRSGGHLLQRGSDFHPAF